MKRIFRAFTHSFVFLGLALNLSANAQSTTARPQATAELDVRARTMVIDGALKALGEEYVFPETAQRMEKSIRERMQRKEYDAITDPHEFARLLTSHLQEISHDKHLRVVTNEDSRLGVDPGRRREMAVKRNYGFERVERLPGNIGYLDLRGFEPADLARETAAAAMSFLSNTDALIIDLRQNGGGSPEMVALLSSYFFAQKTHLNDIYERPENKTREFWTETLPAGKGYGAKPVFVLTSNRTFSAAEEFSYNLQCLKRATIVGETTGGGAHPVRVRPLGPGFLITTPFARSINPITRTNWEGVGVKPDLAAPAEKALKVAHLAALQTIEPTLTDPAVTRDIKSLIDALKEEVGNPVALYVRGPAANPAPAMSSPTAAAPSADFKLPDTPAGRTVGQFLLAFNSGDPEKMKKFHRETGGDEENANQDLGFYRQSGGLNPIRVIEAADYSITILARTKKEGKELRLGMGVDRQPPHGVNEIRVQNTAGPGETRETGPAAAAPGGSKPGETELLKTASEIIETEAGQDRFSGVVLIAKGGKPLLEKPVGMASKSHAVPNRMETRFNLGSINKIFTHVAVLQLVEAGKLDLDAKLGKYLPDYPNRQAAEKVSISQLLNMQSGIGDFFGPKFQATPKDKVRTLTDYLALFADQPLKFEPGTSRAYSNGGYIVLGAIIEKVSGQSYYDYVQDHIFLPAGMEGAEYLEVDAIAPNIAEGYTRRGDVEGKLVSNVYTKPARGSSAGGGYATAEDLLKFSMAIEKNILLNAEHSKAFGKLGVLGGAPGINAALEMGVAGGYTIIVLSNYDPPSAEELSRKIRSLF